MSESCKQVKKSSTDAENQRISMVNGAVQQMMPLEAAERLKDIKEQMLDNISFDDAHALDYAAYYLRAIAAGEYKRVVHAHWEEVEPGHDVLFECSRCGRIISTSWGSCEDEDTHGNNGCDPTEEWLTCPTCGARMDGEDDSHEANL